MGDPFGDSPCGSRPPHAAATGFGARASADGMGAQANAFGYGAEAHARHVNGDGPSSPEDAGVARVRVDGCSYAEGRSVGTGRVDVNVSGNDALVDVTAAPKSQITIDARADNILLGLDTEPGARVYLGLAHQLPEGSEPKVWLIANGAFQSEAHKSGRSLLRAEGMFLAKANFDLPEPKPVS